MSELQNVDCRLQNLPAGPRLRLEASRQVQATATANPQMSQMNSEVPGSEFRVPGFKACPVFVWSRFPAAL